MKSLLFLGVMALFFTEEPSYNFGGRFTKNDDVALTIGVQDGSYWVTFTHANDSSACELSERASVKNGTLRIQYKQGKQPISLIISPADHTKKMIVRGLRKFDQDGLMHFCNNGGSFAGDYNRLP